MNMENEDDGLILSESEISGWFGQISSFSTTSEPKFDTGNQGVGKQ